MKSAEEVKKELISWLKQKHISDVHDLWSNCKYWSKQNLYEMGGVMASFNTEVTIILNVENNKYRFKIDLKEIK